MSNHTLSKKEKTAFVDSLSLKSLKLYYAKTSLKLICTPNLSAIN